MMTARTTIFGLALLAVTSLTACSSMKADRAPFYIYNQSILNEDATANDQPRRSNPYRNTYLDTDGARQDRASRVASASSRRSDGPPMRPEFPPRDKPAPSKAKAPAKAPSKAKVASKPKAPSKPKSPKAGPPARKSRFNPAHAAGYLKAIYEANGIKLGKLEGDDAVATLYAQVKKQGQVYHATRPAIGDLVFFHNTYDRNGDGRNNDWYTHVGLIEGVDDDGTLYVLSYLDGAVQTFPINLEHPRLTVDERSDKVWNAPLRDKQDDDPAFTQYLGGELFAGFGSLLGDRTELVVVDDWKP